MMDEIPKWLFGKDIDGRKTILGWNRTQWIYLLVFMGIGFMLGIQQNLRFVTKSVTAQCNKYIIEKYGWNENLNIIDPYLIDDENFYDINITINRVI